MSVPLRVETIGELQIWIEGKFQLISQAQGTVHDDLRALKSRVHDLSNEISILSAANLPEKIKNLETRDKEQEAAIEKLVLEAAERKSVLATLKAVYVLFGALLGSGITIAFEIYKISH